MTNTLRPVEEVVNTIPSYPCSNCHGSGSDVATGWDGEPEQIQCRDCHAEGKYVTLDCVRRELTTDRTHAYTLLKHWISTKSAPKSNDPYSNEYEEGYDRALYDMSLLLDTVFNKTETK